ncbi:hypothetical protein BH11MYX3_BH11MYX3_02360 [soil metagenome]
MARTASACTGIVGLDDVLGGGLPRDCIHLVQGEKEAQTARTRRKSARGSQ